MKCQVCGCGNIKIIYDGLIRNGGLGFYTDGKVPVYQCDKCHVIWHDKVIENLDQYYQSVEYRESLEGDSDIDKFYQRHDFENADKLKYTGVTVFRNKVVADIGCAGGAFLDYLKGVAKDIVAVEPSMSYRKVLCKKGYHTYQYAIDAVDEWQGKVDVITSFDVIEHVESPLRFMKDVYRLLSEDGVAIIGTPTDAPVMRKLLGNIYEQKLLFSTQHLWIFGRDNLELLARQAGFNVSDIKYFQRYGLSNLLGWLKDKAPCGNSQIDFVTTTLDNVYKAELERCEQSDYIILYVSKREIYEV